MSSLRAVLFAVHIPYLKLVLVLDSFGLSMILGTQEWSGYHGIFSVDGEVCLNV